eukprot:1159539-Pelagomonas_calceolata.AAC.7
MPSNTALHAQANAVKLKLATASSCMTASQGTAHRRRTDHRGTSALESLGRADPACTNTHSARQQTYGCPEASKRDGLTVIICV